MDDRPAVGVVIGRNLRELREGQVLARRELEEMSGVSEPTIARLEGGGVPRPRHATVAKLAKALGVPFERLTSTEDQPRPLVEAPPRRKDAAFIVVGTLVGGEYLPVVQWNVPEEERDAYRPKIEAMLGDDYLEEGMPPSLTMALAAALAGEAE